MRDETKQSEIPGITEAMIPAVVAGARLAKEQTPFDAYMTYVTVDPGCQYGMIFRHPSAVLARQNRRHFSNINSW